MSLNDEEREKELLEIKSKNPTPEQVQAYLDKKDTLREHLKTQPQLDGVESQNIFILGAILFASRGSCHCKACQLLAGIADKSIEFMVDGLLKQKEPKG